MPRADVTSVGRGFPVYAALQQGRGEARGEGAGFRRPAIIVVTSDERLTKNIQGCGRNDPLQVSPSAAGASWARGVAR
ncbi:hypothetical protein E2C01_004728 [Portunus trituberculatus]|uniref:Uncharacterized protein n=1 Tax=Portunus trituberculatus TaxID=210409 RepID=A0A5B7CT37_PORTR|nr:hypothetical protein [Portunus trituberculatus]